MRHSDVLLDCAAREWEELRWLSGAPEVRSLRREATNLRRSSGENPQPSVGVSPLSIRLPTSYNFSPSPMETHPTFSAKLRDLCEKAANEKNPQRMIELAKQIVDLYYSQRSKDPSHGDAPDV